MVVEVGASSASRANREQPVDLNHTAAAATGRHDAATTTGARQRAEPASKSPRGGADASERASLLAEIATEHKALQAQLAEYLEQSERFSQLQLQLEQAAAKQRKRLAEYRKTLPVQREAQASSADDRRLSVPPEVDEADAFLRNRVSATLPRYGGLFVRLFVGSVNVRFLDKRTRLSYKQEYEHFKQQTAPMLVVASLVCLVWTSSRWPSLLLQLFIAYYYSTLALRENILVVNGSNIRQWWRLHHFLSLALAMVVLTWPDGEAYADFRGEIHFLGLYLSLLQIMQARYQMARLYTLRSLGKAGELDVANTDSSAQLHWGTSMYTLLPFILIGHGLQLWTGVRALQVYLRYPRVLQALLGGALVLITFLGNFLTTIRTLRDKVLKGAPS